jgi:hypothetical protein
MTPDSRPSTTCSSTSESSPTPAASASCSTPSASSPATPPPSTRSSRRSGPPCADRPRAEDQGCQKPTCRKLINDLQAVFVVPLLSDLDEAVLRCQLVGPQAVGADDGDPTALVQDIAGGCLEFRGTRHRPGIARGTSTRALIGTVTNPLPALLRHWESSVNARSSCTPACPRTRHPRAAPSRR